MEKRRRMGKRGLGWALLVSILFLWGGMAVPVRAAELVILMATPTPDQVEYLDYDALAAIEIDVMFDGIYDPIPGHFSVETIGDFPEPGHNRIFRVVFLPEDTATYGSRVLGEVELTVTGNHLRPWSIRSVHKVYDGSAGGQGAVLELDDAAGGKARLQVDADLTFDSADVGESAIEWGEVRLTGADAAYFQAEPASLPAAGTINPYPNAVCETADYPVAAGAARSVTLYLDTLAELTAPPDTSDRVYTYTGMENNDGLLEAAPTLRPDGALSLQLGPSVAGMEAAVSYTVGSRNIAPVEGVLRIRSGKIDGAITGVSVAGKTYDGRAVRPAGTPMLGDAAVQDAVYLYTGDGYYSTEPPWQAGSYTLAVSTRDDDPVHTGRSADIPFTIAPARLSITPQDVVIPLNGQVPERFDFAYTGLVGEDTAAVVSPPPVAAVNLADTSRETRADIEITNRPTAANYTVALGKGVLSVRAGALDASYIDTGSPNAAGWYREPVVIKPARPELYDEISLSPTGGFGPSLALAEETAAGQVSLYLRKEGRVSAALPFSYQLDKTPPVLTANLEGEWLVATATDTLSGVAELTVTGPEGKTIAAIGGRYPAQQAGVYTAAAADRAGNRAAKTLERAPGGETPTGTTDPAPSEPTEPPKYTSGGRSGGSSGGSSVRDGDDSVDRFWSSLTDRVREAADGETVRVMTVQQRDRIPADLLAALRGRDLILRFVRPDGDLLLYGKDIPALDQTVYTVEELRTLLPTPTEPSAPTKAAAPAQAPEPTEPTEQTTPGHTPEVLPGPENGAETMDLADPATLGETEEPTVVSEEPDPLEMAAMGTPEPAWAVMDAAATKPPPVTRPAIPVFAVLLIVATGASAAVALVLHLRIK